MIITAETLPPMHEALVPVFNDMQRVSATNPPDATRLIESLYESGRQELWAAMDRQPSGTFQVVADATRLEPYPCNRYEIPDWRERRVHFVLEGAAQVPTQEPALIVHAAAEPFFATFHSHSSNDGGFKVYLEHLPDNATRFAAQIGGRHAFPLNVATYQYAGEGPSGVESDFKVIAGKVKIIRYAARTALQAVEQLEKDHERDALINPQAPEGRYEDLANEWLSSQILKALRLVTAMEHLKILPEVYLRGRIPYLTNKIRELWPALNAQRFVRIDLQLLHEIEPGLAAFGLCAKVEDTADDYTPAAA